jgi:hypothetical protein
MTSVVEKSAPWSTMPGWGIFADLMPPELVASRNLRGLQKKLVVVVGAVVLACIAGYFYALAQHSSAADGLKNAQQDTATITRSQGKYAAVTEIQNATANVRSQLTGLTATNVDFAALMGQVRAALPGTMSITSTSLVLSNGASSATTGSSLSGANDPRVGTVTIAGSGQTLDDLASYVTALSKIPGVIDVLPNSNKADNAQTAFSVSFGFTKALYTTATQTGAK